MDGRYLDAKLRAKRMADAIPGGESLVRWYHKIGEVAKDLVAEDSWFADFGLLTVGPVDGHDLPKLESVLREVAKADRPIVLHVHTVKGKGFEHAEGNATKFHSPPAFQVKGCSVETASKGRAFTAAFSDALASTMAQDDRVVACTAAMPDGTGITRILEEYPDRAWDVGICESHAMDMMAGLAKTGFRPFFAVYSTFLQRAFDQAFQEVSLQGLAVRLCLDRAGLVGGDGAVHHGFCDISLLRTLPNAALLAPIDEPSLKAAVAWMADYDDGLSAVRYPRGTVTEHDLGPCPPFELGRSRPLLTPEDPVAAIISYGTSGLDALEAAEALAAEGMPVEVHDGRFAAPVDLQLLEDLARRELPVITVEDHGLPGGFGAAVAEAASDAGLPLRLRRLGIPDQWIPCGSQSDQKKMAGIDAEAIVNAWQHCVQSQWIDGRSGSASGAKKLGHQHHTARRRWPGSMLAKPSAQHCDATLTTSVSIAKSAIVFDCRGRRVKCFLVTQLSGRSRESSVNRHQQQETNNDWLKQSNRVAFVVGVTPVGLL